MTLVDTQEAGPLVLNRRTAEFVRALGHLILTRVDPEAARRLCLRGPSESSNAGNSTAPARARKGPSHG